MLSSKDKDKDKTKTKAKAKEKRQAETSDKSLFMSFAIFNLNLPGNLPGNLVTTWSLTQKTLTNMDSVNERKSC